MQHSQKYLTNLTRPSNKSNNIKYYLQVAPPHKLRKRQEGLNGKLNTVADISVLNIPSEPDNLIFPGSKLQEDMDNVPWEDDGEIMKIMQMESTSSGNGVKEEIE